MNLTDDFFALHGIDRGFTINSSLLEARFKQLQTQVHPDKFVSANDAEKRRAMQASVRVNEAYQTLRSPLKRAAYLCEINGAPIDEHRNTAMPAGFLVQQIEWREALADIGTNELKNSSKNELVNSRLAALESLQAMVAVERKTALDKLALLLDVERNYALAALEVRALMFIEKFAEEVHLAIDRAEENT